MRPLPVSGSPTITTVTAPKILWILKPSRMHQKSALHHESAKRSSETLRTFPRSQSPQIPFRWSQDRRADSLVPENPPGKAPVTWAHGHVRAARPAIPPDAGTMEQLCIDSPPSAGRPAVRQVWPGVISVARSICHLLELRSRCLCNPFKASSRTRCTETTPVPGTAPPFQTTRAVSYHPRFLLDP